MRAEGVMDCDRDGLWQIVTVRMVAVVANLLLWLVVDGETGWCRLDDS